MLKNRLIAVILVRDGNVVQSVKFKHTNAIHYDAIHAIESFNAWAIDEIVILNVSKDISSKEEFVKIIKKVSSSCFVPLSAGGWISSVEDAANLIHNGADKIIINTEAFSNHSLISDIAKKYGNQCVVVSIDAKTVEENKNVFINRGRIDSEEDVVTWAKKAQYLGAGELFINSINHDGNRKGYDLDLIKELAKNINIPIIAMGGVFKWKHLKEGIEAGASGVAAANIFHYTEHSTRKAKRFLLSEGMNFRKLEKI